MLFVSLSHRNNNISDGDSICINIVHFPNLAPLALPLPVVFGASTTLISANLAALAANLAASAGSTGAAGVGILEAEVVDWDFDEIVVFLAPTGALLISPNLAALAAMSSLVVVAAAVVNPNLAARAARGSLSASGFSTNNLVGFGVIVSG